MCLVQGRIFGRCASLIAPELSKNPFQCMIGYSENTSKTNISVSLINTIRGIKYLNDCDSKTYSDSVEDREMAIYNSEAHKIRHPM